MAGTKDFLLGQIRNGGTLTGGQQLKLCLMLSYPAIIAQLSSVLMQYIDTSMVGHLGAAAGASIGLVSTCMWLLGGFCGACGSGFSVQVAHLIGANDFKTAREVLRQGLVSALIFSGAIALFGMAIAGPLPYWLGGSDEIASDATKYFFIVAACLPFMQIDWMCASMLQVSGNMKVPSYLNIGMCVLDVCFNYLFIYVMDLGVVGAAMGTGLAEIITAAAMLYFLTVRSPELNLLQDKGPFKPTSQVLGKALGIGGPMALQNILIRGGYIAATVIVAPLGTIAIAAHSLAITVESLCYMPGYGIAEAATTLIGQSIGAGQRLLTRSFARMSTALGIGIMTLMGLLMFVFATELMSLMTPVEAIRDLGAYCLRIEAFAEPMFAAAIVCNGIFIGAGDTLKPAIMSLASMWGVRLTLAALLARDYGLKGVWTAMAIELTCRGLLFLARLFFGKWSEKTLNIKH